VPKGEFDWRDKLYSLEGGRRKGVATRIAKRLGRSVQTVYHWLEDGVTPRDLDEILDLIAEKYRVTRTWLKNGVDDPKPILGRASTQALVEAVENSTLPEDYKQVFYALTDDAAARFLVEQLRVYRATVEARRRA
jgi:hypothetical protein